ncbi:hypothetical protein [Actinocorallia longicatena]|uniref:hypothetical protein n=1 Tax=Actinocorallia longicatena TaxID=111803 RepID=UPI0031D337F8
MGLGLAVGFSTVIAGPAQAATATVNVPCAHGRGDVAALMNDIEAGGRLRLGKSCAYRVTSKRGKRSVFPLITKETTISGRNATISWAGTESVGALFEVGENTRLTIGNVRLGSAPTRVLLGRGAAVSFISTSRASASSSSGGPAVAGPFEVSPLAGTAQGCDDVQGEGAGMPGTLSGTGAPGTITTGAPGIVGVHPVVTPLMAPEQASTVAIVKGPGCEAKVRGRVVSFTASPSPVAEATCCASVLTTN